MQNSNANPIDKASVYVAAGLISGCGVLMLNVLPVFIGAMSEHFSFTESQLGDIIAAYNFVFALIAVSALVWVRRFDWRAVSLISIAISALALTALTLANTFVMVAALMAIVGLGSGAVYALIMAALGDSDEPDRAYGLKLGLETLPGAMLLFLLPSIIAPKYGFSGVVITMAVVMALIGFACLWLPSKGVKGISTGDVIKKSRTNNTLCLISLFASLAYVVGLVATWAFLELLGSSIGIPVNTIGMVLSLGFLICGGGGGFLGAVIADRFGRILPLVVAICLNILSLWLLSSSNDVTGFALGSCIFMFTLNFGLTYTFGLTAVIDKAGKLVVLSAAVLSIGGVIGSIVAGRLVESSGYNALFIFSSICSLVALVSYLIADNLFQKADK